MRFDVVTLFPKLVQQVTQWGITDRAERRGLLELKTWNPRDYTKDVHHTVDGRPYGGGPGMVMLYQPLADALQDARRDDSRPSKVVYLSPQGRRLDQASVNRFAKEQRIVLIAGRYEGIDERFIDAYVDEECSVGDYVLSGGELPAMVLIDAVARLLPGALGHKESAQQDSFMDGLLDYPHYTRPELINGRQAPEVLLSGNHAGIAAWRRGQSLLRTFERRPELLDNVVLSDADRQILKHETRDLIDKGDDDEHH
ncbi:MAG: tRNA (guanosine(37)-N1)-methyltransferase TrmD [Thiothrix sp.]|nr:MAG: tRNA (guanosine(37)-N1)-methyltransferase TrmD [Thiothrix sp.]